MKRSGPLFTLLGGLLLALLMLSLNATTGTSTTSSAGGEAGGEKPATKVSPSPAPDPTKTPASPSPSPSAPGNADYAGRTDDDSSAVAVSLRDGRAIAYFCDGRDQESWLKGDVKADGTMRLTSQQGGVLNGELKGNRISGTVDMGQQEYGFTADKALKPSGLYRATESVRGAEVDGGWIVLPDGQQVGIVKRDGTPSAAPRIDPETGAVTVDGQQLTARPVQP
jgi:serine/threonine-protein kinase